METTKKTVKSKAWMAANRELRVELKAAGLEEEDDRRALYYAYYGKQSAAELSAAEIRAISTGLRRARNGAVDKKDKLRKQLIAVLCEYQEENDKKFHCMNREGRIARAKAVATRAAQTKTFNEIGEAKLKALYSGFRKANEATRRAAEVAQEVIMGEI